MKKSLLGATYCIPYVFLAIYGDAKQDTTLFYAVLVAFFALLCIISLRTKNIAALIAGNLLNFASSWLFLSLSDLSDMNWYFKPFTAQSLFFTLSAATWIIQAVIVLWRRKKR